MFSIAHNVYSLCWKQREQRFTVVVLGVDNAGKTTLINTIKGDVTDLESGTSTFGRSNTLIKHGKTTMNFVDLGGGKSMRKYWQDVFAEVHAWIYVVDSACPERFEETRLMLSESSQHDLLASKPLLMFLNKCDLPEALPEDEVAKALKLDELNVSAWQLQRCTALRTAEMEEMDQRITDGLFWLQSAVSKDYSNLDARVERDIVLHKEKEAQIKAQKKAERERKKKEREEREKAEEEAAALAEKEAEQEKVAEVPMKPLGAPSDHSGESSAETTAPPDVPATPPKAAIAENEVATPGEPQQGTLEPVLPKPAAVGELPALKGVPARLEPIQASPGFTDAQTMPPSPLSWKNPVAGVIQDSPIGPSAPITDHPNVPPGSPIA